jgi:hypothetical protein
MNEVPRVRCARCNRVIDKHGEAWIELATGQLKLLTLASLAAIDTFRRAWHADCFG